MAAGTTTTTAGRPPTPAARTVPLPSSSSASVSSAAFSSLQRQRQRQRGRRGGSHPSPASCSRASISLKQEDCDHLKLRLMNNKGLLFVFIIGALGLVGIYVGLLAWLDYKFTFYPLALLPIFVTLYVFLLYRSVSPLEEMLFDRDLATCEVTTVNTCWRKKVIVLTRIQHVEIREHEYPVYLGAGTAFVSMRGKAWQLHIHQASGPTYKTQTLWPLNDPQLIRAAAKVNDFLLFRDEFSAHAPFAEVIHIDDIKEDGSSSSSSSSTSTSDESTSSSSTNNPMHPLPSSPLQDKNYGGEASRAPAPAPALGGRPNLHVTIPDQSQGYITPSTSSESDDISVKPATKPFVSIDLEEQKDEGRTPQKAEPQHHDKAKTFYKEIQKPRGRGPESGASANAAAAAAYVLSPETGYDHC